MFGDTMKKQLFLLSAVVSLCAAQTFSMKQDMKLPSYEEAIKLPNTVQPTNKGQAVQPTPPPYGPNPGDFERWVKEKEAEVESQGRLARLEKQKAKREERWYDLPTGTITVKVAGGSGKYTYTLKQGLASAVTKDIVQNNPVFKIAQADRYNIMVVDAVTGCEAPQDYTISRETMTSATAHFNNIPARC